MENLEIAVLDAGIEASDVLGICCIWTFAIFR